MLQFYMYTGRCRVALGLLESARLRESWKLRSISADICEVVLCVVMRDLAACVRNITHACTRPGDRTRDRQANRHERERV